MGSRRASIVLPEPGLPARRRDRERSLGELLAAHVAEVHVVAVELRLDLVHARRHGIDFHRSGNDSHGLGQRRDAVDFDLAHDGGFFRVRGR